MRRRKGAISWEDFYKGYGYLRMTNTLLTDWMIERLIFDLKYSNKTDSELAEIYGVGEELIYAIDNGLCQHKEHLVYPIRWMIFGEPNDSDKAVMIQKDLISTSMSYDEIAEKYKCSNAIVRRICTGESYRNDKLKYPLRKIEELLSQTQEKVNEICWLLAYTDKSVRQISKLTGIPTSTINYINSGDAKRYLNPNYKYPIRNKK